MTVNLPKTNQTGKNEWADVEDNDLALKAAIEELQVGIPGALGTWYTPKIIATEESRTNTAFGTLATADEIKGVVVPENGLMVIGYHAMWKESVDEAARAAVFLGASQLKRAEQGIAAPLSQEANLSVGQTGEANKAKFFPLGAYPYGLEGSTRTAESLTAYTGPVTTGQVLGVGPSSGTFDGRGSFCVIFAAAGTYNVSIQFKASSGSVTAKDRKLWVCTLG